MPRAARSAARRSATASRVRRRRRANRPWPPPGARARPRAPRVHSTKRRIGDGGERRRIRRVAPRQRRRCRRSAARRIARGRAVDDRRKRSAGPPRRRATSSASTVRGSRPRAGVPRRRRQVHGGSSDNADRDSEIGDRRGRRRGHRHTARARAGPDLLPSIIRRSGTTRPMFRNRRPSNSCEIMRDSCISAVAHGLLRDVRGSTLIALHAPRVQWL